MHRLLAIKSRDLFLLIIAISFAQTYFPQAGEIILLVGITLWMGWTYVIGITMNSIIPQNTRPNTAYFKLSALSILFLFMFNDVINAYQDLPVLSWLFKALRIIVLVNILYLFAFSTRMLQLANPNSRIGFFGLAGIFVCFLVFPIGLWYIHPMAQKGLAKHNQ